MGIKGNMWKLTEIKNKYWCYLRGYTSTETIKWDAGKLSVHYERLHCTVNAVHGCRSTEFPFNGGILTEA